MIDAILHAGHEHPNLWWILVPSFLSFLAGIGIGTRADRVREWVSPERDASSE